MTAPPSWPLVVTCGGFEAAFRTCQRDRLMWKGSVSRKQGDQARKMSRTWISRRHSDPNAKRDTRTNTPAITAQAATSPRPSSPTPMAAAVITTATAAVRRTSQSRTRTSLYREVMLSGSSAPIRPVAALEAIPIRRPDRASSAAS